MSQVLKDKLAEKNSKINAFLSFSSERYLDEKTAESESRRKRSRPLSVIDGKTVAIKENFVWEEGVTNAASKMLEDFRSPYTATAVKKIIAAGGIIVGKTNMDEFAMGSSTETSAYGPAKNPNDLERVPGGSSGGSAAAVAAGMVDLALGSDTGGSIRQPAAFCGVVGFKPTYGAVSRYGLIAMASSLDVPGTFARTVKHAEDLFEVIAGKDLQDSTSFDLGREREFKVRFSGLKIGMPREFFAEGLDDRIKRAVNSVVEKLKSKGAEIEKISLPALPLSLAVYYIIMPVEVSSNMARYDGIKYGFSVEKFSSDGKKMEAAFNLSEVYSKSRALGLGDEVKRRIILGTFASSAGYADKYYLQAQKIRQTIKKEFAEAFKKVDFMLAPATPSLPFKMGEKTADPLQMYLEDIYTVPVNIAGVPALCLPIAKINENGKDLPVGMQIIGKQRDDYRVFDLAQKIEKLLSN